MLHLLLLTSSVVADIALVIIDVAFVVADVTFVVADTAFVIAVVAFVVADAAFVVAGVAVFVVALLPSLLLSLLLPSSIVYPLSLSSSISNNMNAKKL